MQRHWNLGSACVSGLVGTLTLAPVACAGEGPQPGLGDAIQVTTGTATLSVQRPILPDRREFGYTIHFTASEPAESLFPPGWAKQRGTTTVPRN